MITQLLKAFILLTLLTKVAVAAQSLHAGEGVFQSSRIEFVGPKSNYYKTKGNYPEVLTRLLDGYLAWVPTGEKKIMSTECDFDNWKSELYQIKNKAKHNELGSYLQKYFDRCSSELETEHKSLIDNAQLMLSMKFDSQKHPYFHKVLFHLPGNVKLKGYLGLKGDHKPRPLIVVRIGIFSGVEDFFADRAWAMMLFEQSPFNVLMVENLTNGDFIDNNERFSFGGYDEGLQNIILAKLLQDPKESISTNFSSVHFMGISLGGHGVLFASLLNKLNSSKKSPLIKSFLLMCPVVDLKKSMDGLTHKEHLSSVIDLWSRRRLSRIFTKDPEFKAESYFSFLPSLIGKIVKNYQGGLSYTPDIKLPKGMSDSKDYWKLNDFWKYYDNVKEPVLIFATTHDPAVELAQNSQTILEQKVAKNSLNLNVVEAHQGYHCTLPVAYDWSSQVKIYQNYFLANSPEFEMETKEVNLGKLKTAIPLSDLKINLDQLNENSKVLSGYISTFRESDKKLLHFSVGLKDLDFELSDHKLGDSEKEMFIRWANQNLNLKFAKNSPQELILYYQVAK